MWMFDDSKSKDVEADATMMSELREKLGEDLKSLDRISAVSSTPGATVLAMLGMNLADTIGLAKARGGKAQLGILEGGQVIVCGALCLPVFSSNCGRRAALLTHSSLVACFYASVHGFVHALRGEYVIAQSGSPGPMYQKTVV